ncbi:ribosomal protein S18-alanine N-acetyltransferase [uncultured Eubacterium sp.]|uniref:ribosomal protein S18-alanine N-acetyltransferase n=1 Tax=uncultured Eubacterium sp. TaxID=165185 RepID=UPI00259410A3|nr:ribosomal protein S18-alanine N-acetyltransferase [uncultured Eubacterium sp.]
MSNILKNMEKCEDNTLKCDEDVSKSTKTGEEKLIVREMRPEDVPSVAALEEECFSEPWSEQAFSDALKQPEALMMVAEDTQQVPVGYCGMYLSLDEGEITNVAVRPECRKQGIADTILDTVFMEAQKRGAEKIYLEVRQSNIPAQQLYEKHGFESCGLRKNFYRKPTEHAIVMCCDLTRRIKA